MSIDSMFILYIFLLVKTHYVSCINLAFCAGRYRLL